MLLGLDSKRMSGNQTQKATDAQVVIAGAGPVGSTAAYLLARAGIDVVLLESAPYCMEDLRASTFHAATLEMLDEIGVTQELIDMGLIAPVYQYRDRRTSETFAFDLSEIADVTKFPYRVQCEQYKLSRLMVKRLEQMPNARVLFNHRVTYLEQGSRVTVVAETPVKLERFSANYLIAADGANSIVRKWLGAEFEGFTYPEKFVTFSTDYPVEDHFENLSYVNYIADPDEWLVALRVPELWRVQVATDPAASDEQIVSDENTKAVFARLLGPGIDINTAHRTIFKVHQRVATRYVHDRVVLVGDAAHLNNPLGGLGMNSGLHDIWNLCPKIVEILAERGDPQALLGRFERQRRTIMTNFIQSQTKQNKSFMEENNPEAREKQRQRMRSIYLDDGRRREYLLTQSMLNSVRDEAAIH